MRAAPRTTDGPNSPRWTPLLERLEQRETPVVTAGLSQTATWFELGPNVISNGQVRNITAPNPNGGGNVTNAASAAVQALAPHPTQAEWMLAGSPNGGVWRTTNAQAASPIWQPVSDQIASLSVSDISFDPSNPNRVLVGIGGTADGREASSFGQIRGDLIGVLYAENAWDTTTTPTWRIVGGVLANKNILKVAIRNDIWLVATDQGLYRSQDNGATFTNFFTNSVDNFVSFQVRQFNSLVYDLAQNPGRPNQFYVATAPFGDRQREVWRSDDFGLTWGTVTDYNQMQLGPNTTNVKISVRDSFGFTGNQDDNQVYVSVTNSFPSTFAQRALPGLPGTAQNPLLGPGVGPDGRLLTAAITAPPFAWANRNTVVSSICWSTNQGGVWTRMDAPRRLTASQNLDFGDRVPNQANDGGALATSGSGIQLTTSRSATNPHRLQTGDWIYLQNVQPNPTIPNPPPTDIIYDYGLGNYFQVQVTSPTTVLLLDYSGNLVPSASAGYDTKTAFWQRVVDAAPGETGRFGEAGFNDIVAAPSNPAVVPLLTAQNQVYLGGDISQFRFDTTGAANFPISFTGSFWAGDRSTTPNGRFGTANQWANLTDEGTGTRNAPGGDTREMAFDATGQLWVATGTGIYRRSTAANSNWSSASGNLRVGQFWSVGYDTVNNLVAGSTQDTGMVEQVANGSLLYNAFLQNNPTLLEPLIGRNSLTDQEYAYETAVDNVSSPGQSIRYYASSNFHNIQRRVFNNTGGLVSATNLTLANSLTTSAPRSGITGTDLGLFQDSSARIVMSLNRNDQRRAAYGLTSVYEDSDPFGPGNTPVTGAVVNNVTPNGFTGRVSAMAYGGRRVVFPGSPPQNFNQVMFVGTTTGQLWFRGEFGTTFTQVAPGTGPVTSIEADPDDYRHVFVAQGGQVYETRDLGLNWTNLSAGLVAPADPANGLATGSALTTAVYSIALVDPNPNQPNVGTTGDVVLLAGGRGGVFRRTLSVCSTSAVWSEYGNGLPNSVVTDLSVVTDQTGAIRLVAGTFGRGVWSVPDVRPTLTNTLFLDITGDAAANTISITSDPLDPNAVIVSDGGALNQRFSFGQFDQIRVFAQGGADTVTISGGTSANGLRFVNYPITVSMGGDPGDRLVLNASAATIPIQATVGASVIGRGAGDNVFNGCGSLTYSGLDRGTLSLFTGAGNDTLILENGPLPPTIELGGGAGNDVYYVNSASTSNVFLFNSPGSQSALFVTMPAGQTAFVDAANRTFAAGTLSVTANQNVTNLLLNSLGNGGLVWTSGPGPDTVSIAQDPALGAAWTWVENNGYFVRFTGMANVSVNTGSGSQDVVRVDSNGLLPGGNTLFVTYNLSVNLGGDANDSLLVDTSGSTTPVVANISGSAIWGASIFGPNGVLSYSGLAAGAMYLTTGSGFDRLYFSAAARHPVVVDAGTGFDQVWVLGTAGDDVTSVTGNSVSANRLNIFAAVNTEQFGVTGEGGVDQLFATATAGNDALSITQVAPRIATLGGLPVSTTFYDMQFVSLNGVAGTDSLDWVDGSNFAWGTPVDPSTGLVFAPTGPSSGSFTLGGAAGTTTRFSNIAGNVAANGDPGSTNTRDVLSVLGASSAALGSQFGEVTAADGSDTIAALDTAVTVTNASLGQLKPIAFAFTAGGQNTFSTVFVRGGNEVGTGDTFTASTTTRTNLLLDGGNPTAPPGDRLTITTNGPAATTQSSNPLLGPPHTRVTSRSDQSSVGYLNFEQVVSLTVDPSNPGGPPIPSLGSQKSDLFAAGTDAGAPSEVRVYNLNGTPRFTLNPFPGFTGGTRVAVGDVTGDGKSDVIVAAGPGGTPHVIVYDGQTAAVVRSFFAYDPTFTGGVSVAAGYFDDDRFADIVVGAGAGGGPHVKLFDGSTGAVVRSFFAYAPTFVGGVNVAAGDVNGDGLADFITGTASGTPHVRLFNGLSTEELNGVFAFDPASSNGVNVAAADITGDGIAEVITGAGPGGTTTVRVFDARTMGVIRDFVVNDPTIPGVPPIDVTSGVRVSTADFDGDGLADVLTGRGAGSRPFAQAIKVSTLTGGVLFPSLTSLLAVNTFGDTYSNGIYVGA